MPKEPRYRIIRIPFNHLFIPRHEEALKKKESIRKRVTAAVVTTSVTSTTSTWIAYKTGVAQFPHAELALLLSILPPTVAGE